jgi:hypothetical protein
MGHFKNLLITLMESPDPDDLELLLLAGTEEPEPEKEGEDIADQRLPD